MTDTHHDADAHTLILVPLDGSPLAEQAIPYASALAGAQGTLLFLQATSDTEPVYGFLGNIEATRDEVGAAYVEGARQELAAAQERWQQVTPTVETMVVSGDPADEILRVAGERKCSMIVMASHGRGALGRWTFGSVADRVARTSSVPVMIVRPQDAMPEIALPVIRRVLVPLDGSKLSQEALPVAGSIASRLGISVLLVRVINVTQALAPYPSMAAAYPPEVYQQLEADMRTDAQNSLDPAAKTLTSQGVEVSTAVESGGAAHSIEDATEQGDIIVMTSHGRSGIRRWLLGSVAEQLVRHATVPVILVRAADES
ncbi:MAG TPA: universal stress protein [Thermomicrobiales bacterium]|nr:universal stress protein [Thermomicrobiales bacterium]